MRLLLLIVMHLYYLPINILGQDQILFDEIRLTETIANYGLTGEGTIIAVLDRGIDYKHPDFIDEDGKTRILSIFDLSHDSGAFASNNPYGKGTIYSADDINVALIDHFHTSLL